MAAHENRLSSTYTRDQVLMKIVITGGCGYIGSHISRYLKQNNENCHIYVIDRERRDHTLRDVMAFYMPITLLDKVFYGLMNYNPMSLCIVQVIFL